MQALLDDGGTDLSKVARRSRIPLRTLQDWELRDEPPDTNLARERWEKFVAACTPPGEEREDMNHVRLVTTGTTPPDDPARILEQLERLEDMGLELIKEAKRLSREIKAAQKRRHRGTG
jgi:hypothetical protein